MAPVLETVGLEKHFGGLTAVAGLSLKIEKGAVPVPPGKGR